MNPFLAALLGGVCAQAVSVALAFTYTAHRDRQKAREAERMRAEHYEALRKGSTCGGCTTSLDHQINCEEWQKSVAAMAKRLMEDDHEADG